MEIDINPAHVGTTGTSRALGFCPITATAGAASGEIRAQLGMGFHPWRHNLPCPLGQHLMPGSIPMECELATKPWLKRPRWEQRLCAGSQTSAKQQQKMLFCYLR